MINVIVVDDHEFIIDGIKALLSSDTRIQVVGEATNGKMALKLIREKNPDLLISDISMPEMSGLELIEKAKKVNPNLEILILSTHLNEENILASYKAGAKGYLPKNSSRTELILAIKKIANGEVYSSASVLNVLGSSALNKGRDNLKVFALTKREKEILKELVEGFSNKEIAANLFISVRTVDTHRSNIMKKLNVNSGMQLVKVCLEQNLLD